MRSGNGVRKGKQTCRAHPPPTVLYALSMRRIPLSHLNLVSAGYAVSTTGITKEAKRSGLGIDIRPLVPGLVPRFPFVREQVVFKVCLSPRVLVSSFEFGVWSAN